MFLDRPQSIMDTAIFWTEYVIRYNGAPQLRSAAADLPWYQEYLLDVLAFYLLVIYLLKKTVLLICCRTRKFARKTKAD